MNENKELNSSSTDIDKKRRAFTKAGVATPVVLSLVSQPVFGVPCLSQMMSGNLSNPGEGSCVLGKSPRGWKNPGGFPGIDTWVAAGFDYGTLIPGAGINANKCDSYTGGTTFAEAFGSGDSRPMREIMCESPNSVENHLCAALLNAAYFDDYVLSVAQVKQLYLGTFTPLTGASESEIRAYLDATWD